MLKFQLETKADLKKAAIIQQKRCYEEERKSRIFNAKERTIGVSQEILRKFQEFFFFVKFKFLP